MKVIKGEDAEKFTYADTSSVLEYGIALNEKNMDFCINKITGRYPVQGHCSNLNVEELCYVLNGEGTIHKKGSGPISFKKGDIIFINKKEIYCWDGDFEIAIVCSPAWSKEQCRLYGEEDFK